MFVCFKSISGSLLYSVAEPPSTLWAEYQLWCLSAFSHAVPIPGISPPTCPHRCKASLCVSLPTSQFPAYMPPPRGARVVLGLPGVTPPFPLLYATHAASVLIFSLTRARICSMKGGPGLSASLPFCQHWPGCGTSVRWVNK